MIAEEAVDDDPNAGDDIARCRLLGIASRTVDTYRCSIRYEGATLREDLTYDRLRQRYFYALRQAGEKKVARGSCALNDNPRCDAPPAPHVAPAPACPTRAAPAVLDGSMATSRTGYVLASSTRCQRVLLVTNDGGSTFQLAGTLPDSPSRLAFASASRGYAYDHGISETIDGGRSWHHYDFDPGGRTDALAARGQEVLILSRECRDSRCSVSTTDVLRPGVVAGDAGHALPSPSRASSRSALRRARPAGHDSPAWIEGGWSPPRLGTTCGSRARTSSIAAWTGVAGGT
jgi:hypothetical protein